MTLHEGARDTQARSELVHETRLARTERTMQRHERDHREVFLELG
jgi:hypothetical protein